MNIDPHTWSMGKDVLKAVNKPPEGRTLVRRRVDTCACGTKRYARFYGRQRDGAYYTYIKNGVKYPHTRVPPCQEDRQVAPIVTLSPKGHDWEREPWQSGIIPYRIYESRCTKKGHYRKATCKHGCGVIRIDRKSHENGKKVWSFYYKEGMRHIILPACEPL